MVTVVTEGIFSYCGAKVKIDTDRHIGPERALIRAEGEAIGHVTTGEYGSRMLSLGGVEHLTGGSRAEGRATCAALLALCNSASVDLTVDGGAALTLQAERAADKIPPWLVGVLSDGMEMMRNTIFAAVLALMPLAASGQDFDAGLAAAQRGDYAVALKEWRPLAEQGYADAQSNLGLMYRNGHGVPQDFAEALRWYRLAAEQGNYGAQFNLGLMYANGQGVPQDDAEAVRWYRLAAEQGHAAAQSNLGLMYDTGRGVPQDDAEAVRWYRLAAEQGYAAAQSNLRLMHADGRVSPQDDAEAVGLYRLAAEQGNARAQFNLGLMYANGQGVPQDFAEAGRWYRLAAEQGVAVAQSNLGGMYFYGQGVPQDYVTAHMWFNVAVADGHSSAADARDAVASLMSGADLSEAQRRAQMCLKSGYSDCD